MTYNYYEAMERDIREYIEDNSYYYDYRDLYERGRLYDTLYDDMWTADIVTGNGSGSYTFNAREAGECVAGNMDLLKEACLEFCCDTGTIFDHLDDYEWQDVTIRCYLLGCVLGSIVEELEEAIQKEIDSEEKEEEEK